MANWKEGDRVQVISRPVTEDDRKNNRYFAHMGGLIGTVQNIYGPNEVAVLIDEVSMSKVSRDVHQTAIERMRDKFLNSISDEQKKTLTSEELKFNVHYMLLVSERDLEKAS